MRSSRNAWLGTALMLALSPGAIWAQQSSQSSSSPATQHPTTPDQKTKPAPAKNPKVWTDEDISSLRTSEDNYIDQERLQASEAAAKPSQPASPAKSAPQAAPPALSNPKTVEDADKMIAWEERDLAAHQETLDNFQKQLESAPDSDKPRLEDQIQKSMRIIAETNKEKQALETQKRELEKKPETGKSTATGQPQSQ